MLAVGIARVSTETQDLTTQVHQITNYCGEKNYELLDMLTIKCSAYTEMPEQLSNLVAEITKIRERGAYSKNDLAYQIADTDQQVLFVFTDVDRMARNTVNGIEFINELDELDIKVEFVRESAVDLSTPDGRNYLRTKLSQAELESDRISQRTRQAYIVRRFLGHHIGRAPYGKRVVDGKLVDSEAEQAVINIINLMNGKYTVEEVLNAIYQYHLTHLPGEVQEGYAIYLDNMLLPREDILVCSLENMAQILNCYGITRRGEPWTASKVAYVYRNFGRNKPVYQRAPRKRSFREMQRDNSDSDSSDPEMQEFEHL